MGLYGLVATRSTLMHHLGHGAAATLVQLLKLRQAGFGAANTCIDLPEGRHCPQSCQGERLGWEQVLKIFLPAL